MHCERGPTDTADESFSAPCDRHATGIPAAMPSELACPPPTTAEHTWQAAHPVLPHDAAAHDARPGWIVIMPTDTIKIRAQPDAEATKTQAEPRPANTDLVS